MTGRKQSTMHVAMFPWFAFGHFTPFLHLSNKIAERGHQVSVLVPKGAQPRLQQLSQYPNLIHFFPLEVPQVDGLPPGAETASDVPYHLHTHLCTAFDQTRDQVRTILGAIKPDVAFYDLAYWVPALGRELSFKSISYAVVCAAGAALLSVPSKKINKSMTLEEIMETPPGYPSAKVVLRPDAAAQVRAMTGEAFGANGMSFCERLIAIVEEGDAIAMRTFQEIEGQFCDYLAQQYAKPVLLTGPILPETPPSQLEEKWDKWEKWLSKFQAGSVVYCAFGSQIILQRDQFQELLMGFELCGLPFLLALAPPHGCSSVEEAFPEGFEERVQGRGWVYGGWVPQVEILKHPSVGCFVSHCGYGSMWESLLSDCQIVLVPHLLDQIVGTMLMVEELGVAVEAKREENGLVSRNNLSIAIKLVMDKDSEFAAKVNASHAKWRNIVSRKDLQDLYVDNFMKDLHSCNLGTIPAS